jgi:hypothetical protein
MRVVDSFSSKTRNALTDDDWLAIRDAGPGEVRFARFDGEYNATVSHGQARAFGRGKTPRKAFDSAVAKMSAAA